MTKSVIDALDDPVEIIGSSAPMREELKFEPDILQRCALLDQNDRDNGYRLLAHWGADLAFIPEWGWTVWKDSHWEADNGAYFALAEAQKLVEAIRAEIPFIDYSARDRAFVEAWGYLFDLPLDKMDDAEKPKFRSLKAMRTALGKRRDARGKFAVSVGNAERSRKALQAAEPHCLRSVNEFDNDPMAFNVNNGTLRFKKIRDPDCQSMSADPRDWRFAGEAKLFDHRRDDLMTKCAPVTFDPSATYPKWQAFLDKFVPDKSEQRFLQAYFGYSMTGQTGEQVLLYNYGGGANGKSTFLLILGEIFGAYGRAVPPETFTGTGQRRGDQASPDLARLPGARMVTVEELPAGEALKEGLVKQLTGGSAIVTRKLNEDFFEFYPVFKAVMTGNDLPNIKGTDHGIWRRIRILEWKIKLSAEERLPLDKVKADLLTEKSGILNWLVEGACMWLGEGLESFTPQSVRDFTEQHKADRDPLGEFIEDCIVKDRNGRASAREIYQGFKRWCDANAVRQWSETAFGRAFGKMGYEHRKVGGGVKTYFGIDLTGVALESNASSGTCRDLMS